MTLDKTKTNPHCPTCSSMPKNINNLLLYVIHLPLFVADHNDAKKSMKQ
jgi:hypothetical protein